MFLTTGFKGDSEQPLIGPLNYLQTLIWSEQSFLNGDLHSEFWTRGGPDEIGVGTTAVGMMALHHDSAGQTTLLPWTEKIDKRSMLAVIWPDSQRVRAKLSIGSFADSFIMATSLLRFHEAFTAVDPGMEEESTEIQDGMKRCWWANRDCMWFGIVFLKY